VSTEPGPHKRASLPAGLGAMRPRPLPAHRTLVLCAGLVAFGAVLAPYGLGPVSSGHGNGGFLTSWWGLTAVFSVAAIFVFHVEIDSEAHTFSLSEVPLALGLMFADPRELLLARLVGEALVLIGWERQSAPKLIFNISLFFAETTAALAVFRTMDTTGDPVNWQTWLAALAGVGIAAVLGASAVWGVIRVHGGRVDPGQLLQAAAITSGVNTSLATIAAVLVAYSRPALVPLLVIVGMVVAAYRGYTRLTRRYAGLELLYQFTRITGGSHSPDETMHQVLEEASRLLRTHRALIALYAPHEQRPWLVLSTGPDDDQATDVTAQPEQARGPTPRDLPELLRRQVLDHGQLVLIPRTAAEPDHRAVLEELGAKDCLAAPLISGGEVTGVLAVFDRLGDVSTFDGEDGRLFATLASQAAVALENGRLIDRLQTQIQAREHEAMHDALTGLPNRTLFFERLCRAIEHPDRRQVGVLVLDLDGFKDVNDTLGHHTGDQLLCQVAERLSAVVEDSGTVARLGGDEFAVLLPHLDGVTAGLLAATRINEAIRRPIELPTMTLAIGVSVGMAAAPDHGSDPAGLLQRADVAMYQAKRGQTGVSLYDPNTDWNSQFRLRLAGELRGAVRERAIEVWYQPIARAGDGRVVGVEALARWHHPDLGAIAPSEFIPVAERTGLIHELTLHVLDRALAQARVWLEQGMDLRVAVNLPPQVLRDVEWPAKVVQLLHEQRVPARCLALEITESGIMTDPERMISLLRELTSTGISLSIDDFGTGYSSLAYLQQLPVSTVKIDRSFVAQLTGDDAAAAIVSSVIELARSLGLVVVAEGVEDEPTLARLNALDCHFVQGYLLSRPVPGPELTRWLAAHGSGWADLHPDRRSDLR